MRFVPASCLTLILVACHSPEPSAPPAPSALPPAGDVVASPVVAGDVVVTVLGKPVTRDQLEGDEAYAILPAVLGPLLNDFAAREGIEATEPEIARFDEFLSKHEADLAVISTDTDDEDDVDADIKREADREVAQESVKDWKVCRALYARYGGTVIFQQLNPLEPVGAYLAFLREHEQKGSFQFHDDRLAAQFWDYFTRDHGPWVVDPASVDYSVPWWEK
jgi:hypothetical protein